MTSTDTTTPAERGWIATATDHWLIPQPDGRYLLGAPDGGIYLAHADLERMADALTTTFFGRAPTMTRVLGRHLAEAPWLEVMTEGQAAAALAEGWDVVHGLACPYPDCEQVAWEGYGDGVYVVDAGERWSRFEYEREHRNLDGSTCEAVTGDYDGDEQFDGTGYRCTGCARPVTLPDGVQEA